MSILMWKITRFQVQTRRMPKIRSLLEKGKDRRCVHVHKRYKHCRRWYKMYVFVHSIDQKARRTSSQPRRSPRLVVKALNGVLIKRRKQAEERLRWKPLKTFINQETTHCTAIWKSGAVLRKGKSTRNSLEVTNRCLCSVEPEIANSTSSFIIKHSKKEVKGQHDSCVGDMCTIVAFSYVRSSDIFYFLHVSKGRYVLYYWELLAEKLLSSKCTKVIYLLRLLFDFETLWIQALWFFRAVCLPHFFLKGLF